MKLIFTYWSLVLVAAFSSLRAEPKAHQNWNWPKPGFLEVQQRPAKILVTWTYLRGDNEVHLIQSFTNFETQESVHLHTSRHPRAAEFRVEAGESRPLRFSLLPLYDHSRAFAGKPIYHLAEPSLGKGWMLEEKGGLDAISINDHISRLWHATHPLIESYRSRSPQALAAYHTPEAYYRLRWHRKRLKALDWQAGQTKTIQTQAVTIHVDQSGFIPSQIVRDSWGTRQRMDAAFVDEAVWEEVINSVPSFDALVKQPRLRTSQDS